MPDGATADGPARRRASWSLKTIVEDVSGRPIGEFQDPSRPVHPYLQAKLGAASGRGGNGGANAPEERYDPVGHVYPPLVGAAGRDYHGPDHEHHAETLERHRPPPAALGERVRLPGPLSRPERLYLHYLLLHLDRLGDAALRYLRTTVDEELAHRARTSPGPLPPPTPIAPLTSTDPDGTPEPTAASSAPAPPAEAPPAAAPPPAAPTP